MKKIKSGISKAPIQKRLGNFEQLKNEWKAIHIMLTTDPYCEHWIENESHFESICVGWCLAKGLTLMLAMDFYQAMIPLELF